MKIVVDTNVLISCIFFDGPPARILKAWHNGNLQRDGPAEAIREREGVLRPFRFGKSTQNSNALTHHVFLHFYLEHHREPLDPQWTNSTPRRQTPENRRERPD